MKQSHKQETDDFSNDPWESRTLGASEKHACKLPHKEELAIDEALGLQIISIRLQKKLIANLKLIAKHEGIGYQPLIRQVLTHFVRDQKDNHSRRHAR